MSFTVANAEAATTTATSDLPGHRFVQHLDDRVGVALLRSGWGRHRDPRPAQRHDRLEVRPYQ